MAGKAPVFDFKAFYGALSATRESRELTWKEVAEQVDVSPSTLTRMAQSRRPDADSLAALAAWSGLNPADFVLYGSRAPVVEPLAEITRVVRGDTRLDPNDAAALEDIVKAAYSRMLKRVPSKDGGR